MTSRFVKSNQAPKPFRDWLRDNPRAAAWDDLPTTIKNDLRVQLAKDQQGFCCYCYTRVNAEMDYPHIEHIEPQDENNRFDWKNLALACEGGNRSRRLTHCDHAKGEAKLEVVHPYRNPVPRQARLRPNGTLHVPDGKVVERDINDVLCLNREHLKQARKNALTAVMRDLEGTARFNQPWRPRDIESALASLPPTTPFEPFLRDWLVRQQGSR